MSGARAVLITGAQASGKSTVGRLLASRLERAAFIEGDVLWQMVVAGRADMSDGGSMEARAQLELRYRHGAMLAASFVQAGFTAVHVDNIYGADVSAYVASMRCACSVVVLRPRAAVVAERATKRGGDVYRPWVPEGGDVVDAVRQFEEWLDEIPPIGVRIDSSEQSPDETVDEILDRWTEGVVTSPDVSA